jgi:hypothetical protein
MSLTFGRSVVIQGFGGFDHKDREFEYQFRVIGLFRVFSIELECLFVGKKSCLFARSQMGCLFIKPKDELGVLQGVVDTITYSCQAAE